MEPRALHRVGKLSTTKSHPVLQHGVPDRATAEVRHNSTEERQQWTGTLLTLLPDIYVPR